MTDAPSRFVRIDSHHHLWDPARRDYPWFKGVAVLERPFGIDDLRPLLRANDIDGAVLVQTLSDLDETREFLQIAAENDEVVGVVGWVDLLDPAIAATLAELKSGPGGEYLVGIRHQIHDETDPDWALQEQVQLGFETIAEANLVYDLLVKPVHLPAAITVARDFPHLRFVLDHIAKPPIASGSIEEWAALMHEFAGLGNVACKLSGMVTEAAADTWTPDDLRPYVNTALEVFGPDRLMFGSDWPVCLLAASYDQVLETLRTVLADLGVADEDALAGIFGRTATHWYGLNI
ncbi:MAG: amidohydrolase family protein [Thermomicrobiales bacterium]